LITADTNVLVYLWDVAAPAKQQTAQFALAHLYRLGGPMGLQVVGELQNVLRRKLRYSPPEAAARARIILQVFDIFTAAESNADEALTIVERGALNYWDALLATAARDAGCRVMLSEDMQDGARFGGLEIVNPFGAAGAPSARLQALLKP
jgi:predicted nucleic acid-binding protein